MSDLTWISEGDRLPRIGQQVLLAKPRQCDDVWFIATVHLLARHEDVVARPVKPGDQWPLDYYWSRGRGDNVLLTGEGWWASLAGLPLPPGAEHASLHGYDFVRTDPREAALTEIACITQEDGLYE